MSLPVPGLSVTRPSKICCRTYDEFAATTRVPPCLGVPAVDADGSTDGAVEAPVEAGGATDAGAELVVAPPQAANMIAVVARSAPMRTRVIAPPPVDGSTATAMGRRPMGGGRPERGTGYRGTSTNAPCERSDGCGYSSERIDSIR